MPIDAYCDIVFQGSNSYLPLNPEGIGLEYVLCTVDPSYEAV